MIKLNKKGIIGTLMLLLLTGVLLVVMLFVNLDDNVGISIFYTNEEAEEARKSGYQGVFDTVRGLEDNFEEAFNSFYALIQAKADLSAKSLRDVVTEKGDDSITKLTDGCVAKIENGEITLPQGTRTGIRKYASQITGEKGRLFYDTVTKNGTRKDFLVYSHIKGPYYYLEIINGKELNSYTEEYVKYESFLTGMDGAYNISAFLICPDYKNSRFFFNMPGNLIYPVDSDSEQQYLNAEDLGLPSDPDLILSKNDEWLSSEDINYSYIAEEIEALDSYLLILVPQRDALMQAFNETGVGALSITALCFVFLVWIVSVYKKMFGGTLTEKERSRYSPTRVRVITVSFGIIGMLIVFAVNLYMRSLNNLFEETGNLSNELNILEYQLWMMQDENEQSDLNRKMINVEYAQRIAELLERYPQLNRQTDLEEMSNIVGARYVMLFDAYGRETISSSEYINIELGDENAKKPSTTADFRRILKGVPYIVHDAVRDEVTGRSLELTGVRTNDHENGGYGVLIMAMKPPVRESDEEQILSVMRSLTPVGKICFSIDPETGTVCNSTEESLYGYWNPAEYGVKGSEIRGGISDFMTIAGIKCFCMSAQMEENGTVYYFATPTQMLFGNGTKYALSCAIGFGIVFALLSLYLLMGYTNKTLEKAQAVHGEPEGQDAPKKTGTVRQILVWIRHKLSGITPEEKAAMTARVIVAYYIIKLFFKYRDAPVSEKSRYVFNYILGGEWVKGINLFSITAIVLLLCSIALGMFFVRLVLAMIGNTMNPKGQTICRLIANLIGYLSILVFVYYALSYIGVDTNAILASVGVLGIGISMGARDLIADIFAGISIIVEGEYQVGDFVSIDGYRGKVQEIGVRSTRLIGRGENVKVIGNKDIKTVVNLTKNNSWVPITIKVDVNYPLRDVEEILEKTLPRVGESYEEIISGPFYKGVLSVEGGFAVLSIIAECHEGDFYMVERTLVREVLLALRDQNVPVR